MSADLDRALVAQLVVAWAGESGEEPRMGWWRTDLLSAYGGEDLFSRLLPQTWEWAVLRAVREAARRHELAALERHHDPDRIVSLFHLGFDDDERLDERLSEFERGRAQRSQVLPRLDEVVSAGWNQTGFQAWIRELPPREFEVVPLGRRLFGAPPRSLVDRVHALVAALDPPAQGYPVPHFVVAEGVKT